MVCLRPMTPNRHIYAASIGEDLGISCCSSRLLNLHDGALDALLNHVLILFIIFELFIFILEACV